MIYLLLLSSEKGLNLRVVFFPERHLNHQNDWNYIEKVQKENKIKSSNHEKVNVTDLEPNLSSRPETGIPFGLLSTEIRLNKNNQST